MAGLALTTAALLLGRLGQSWMLRRIGGSQPRQLSAQPSRRERAWLCTIQRRYVGRDHFKEIFAATDTNKFVVSLGDLGESKDCTGSGSLFAGSTECFKLARALGFGLRRAPQG